MQKHAWVFWWKNEAWVGLTFGKGGRICMDHGLDLHLMNLHELHGLGLHGAWP